MKFTSLQCKLYRSNFSEATLVKSLYNAPSLAAHSARLHLPATSLTVRLLAANREQSETLSRNRILLFTLTPEL